MNREELEELIRYHLNETRCLCNKYCNEDNRLFSTSDEKIKELNILINELTKKRDRLVELKKIASSNILKKV